MEFRIAGVSFVNTVPLIDGLDRCSDGYSLKLELPSRLGALLDSGEADVALLPVVETLRGRSAGIISAAGIACRGPVDSVKLFHSCELTEMKSVLVDRGSRTSVALLRILLAEVCGIRPVFEEFEPDADLMPSGGQGALIIGDRCLAFDGALGHATNSGVRSWDLGQAWWELTGLPFIFATWAVSHGFKERALPADVAALAEVLNSARDDGIARIDELAAREAGRGRVGHKGEATAEALVYYFRKSLVFTLGDEEMAGLGRFHELCVKHGVVPAGPPPEILRG